MNIQETSIYSRFELWGLFVAESLSSRGSCMYSTNIPYCFPHFCNVFFHNVLFLSTMSCCLLFLLLRGLLLPASMADVIGMKLLVTHHFEPGCASTDWNYVSLVFPHFQQRMVPQKEKHTFSHQVRSEWVRHDSNKIGLQQSFRSFKLSTWLDI